MTAIAFKATLIKKNLKNDYSVENILERRVSNQSAQGEKHKSYLCVMQSPFYNINEIVIEIFELSPSGASLEKGKFKFIRLEIEQLHKRTHLVQNKSLGPKVKDELLKQIV